MRLFGLLGHRDPAGQAPAGESPSPGPAGEPADAGESTKRPSEASHLAGGFAEPFRRQLRWLSPVIAASLLAALGLLWVDSRRATVETQLAQFSAQALSHSQRAGRAAGGALSGEPDAFSYLEDSRRAMGSAIAALKLISDEGARLLIRLPEVLPARVALLEQQWRASDAAARDLGSFKLTLESIRKVRKAVNDSNQAMFQAAQRIAAQRLALRANPREISAAAELVMLTQKIGKQVNQLLLDEPADEPLARLLSADITRFSDLVTGFEAGSNRLGLGALDDSDSRAALATLKSYLDRIEEPVGRIVVEVGRIKRALEAERTLIVDSEKLRDTLLMIQREVGPAPGESDHDAWVLMLLALAAGCGAWLVRSYLRETRLQAAEAMRQRREAEKLEQDAKRINDQNQAAILRLMNELQEVADGNLMVQPTVTEDITGAIADSVGYTLEELRAIVTRINSTTELVGRASSKAQQIGVRLQAASERQSDEIRATGDAVLTMAKQINQVALRAAASAKVARRSLSASESGAAAVQNAIAGMNGIRNQIQETAKRIKRLGESSQEVGEIVELISDITEQTNVLALNAAIQAASAGEAGRGFTVVAEEVQRLAERSAQATRDIAALIRAIQTDTQDAVAAMERSTQGVVEGTRLSDEAGKALGEIARVSRQLAELIEGFSRTASTQAISAGGVAESIERILTVTEQTSRGTMLTAASIRQLSELAQKLRASVSKFKVA